MSKILIIEIDTCRECAHSGMYYNNSSMSYRNKCEYPGAKSIYISNGDNIPDDCPLQDTKNQNPRAINTG